MTYADQRKEIQAAEQRGRDDVVDRLGAWLRANKFDEKWLAEHSTEHHAGWNSAFDAALRKLEELR